MTVKKITNNDLTELNAAKVALLDVSATWCGPCKMIAPVVESLSEQLAGRVEFYNADADENPELVKKLRIMSIPHILIIQEGKVKARQAGFVPEPELKAWIEEHI